MQTISEQYIVDSQGQRLSVVLEFDYYQKLLARLEELEEIYAFDIAEEYQDEAIPFAQANRLELEERKQQEKGDRLRSLI